MKVDEDMDREIKLTEPQQKIMFWLLGNPAFEDYDVKDLIEEHDMNEREATEAYNDLQVVKNSGGTILPRTEWVKEEMISQLNRYDDMIETEGYIQYHIETGSHVKARAKANAEHRATGNLIQKIASEKGNDSNKWRHIRQKEISGKERSQAMFPGTTPTKKPRVVTRRRDVRGTRQKGMEKYEAEVRERGKPKLSEYEEEITYKIKRDSRFINLKLSEMTDEELNRVVRRFRITKYDRVAGMVSNTANIWEKYEKLRVYLPYDIGYLGMRSFYLEYKDGEWILEHGDITPVTEPNPRDAEIHMEDTVYRFKKKYSPILDELAKRHEYEKEKQGNPRGSSNSMHWQDEKWKPKLEEYPQLKPYDEELIEEVKQDLWNKLKGVRGLIGIKKVRLPKAMVEKGGDVDVVLQFDKSKLKKGDLPWKTKGELPTDIAKRLGLKSGEDLAYTKGAGQLEKAYKYKGIPVDFEFEARVKGSNPIEKPKRLEKEYPDKPWVYVKRLKDGEILGWAYNIKHLPNIPPWDRYYSDSIEWIREYVKEHPEESEKSSNNMHWKDIAENLRENDIKLLDRDYVDEKYLSGMWRDIQEHRDIALRLARTEEERRWCREGFDDIEDTFHKGVFDDREKWLNESFDHIKKDTGVDVPEHWKEITEENLRKGEVGELICRIDSRYELMKGELIGKYAHLDRSIQKCKRMGGNPVASFYSRKQKEEEYDIGAGISHGMPCICFGADSEEGIMVECRCTNRSGEELLKDSLDILRESVEPVHRPMRDIIMRKDSYKEVEIE